MDNLSNLGCDRPKTSNRRLPWGMCFLSYPGLTCVGKANLTHDSRPFPHPAGQLRRKYAFQSRFSALKNRLKNPRRTAKKCATFARSENNFGCHKPLKITNLWLDFCFH